MNRNEEFNPYNEGDGNQNTNNNRVDGGNTAMCIIALILAVIAATLSVKHEIDANDKVAAVEKRMNDKIGAAETRAMDYAYLAKQEARIALEQGQKAETIAKEKHR